MTGPFYSVGPIKSALLGASVITDFITQFRDLLVSCNWTVLSTFIGVGNTPGYVFLSYPTPTRNQIQVKVYYNGDHTPFYPTIRFMVYDSVGGNEQIIGFLSISSSLGNKTIRCICGPHQFFIFIDTTIPPNQNYHGSFDVNNVMAGCPKVNNLVKTEVYWGMGDNGHQRTWRENLNAGGLDYYSFLINGITPWTSAFPDPFGNTNNIAPTLLSQRSSDLHSPVPHFSGSWPVIEPLCFIGRVPNSYYGVYLWDAIIVGTRFNSAILSQADNHTWESITLSADGGVVGSLFLATSKLTGASVGSFSY